MNPLEAVKAEAPDWDDDVVWEGRFRAFSGQKSDWASRYFFWRDLIVRVARRLGVLSFRSSEVSSRLISFNYSFLQFKMSTFATFMKLTVNITVVKS